MVRHEHEIISPQKPARVTKSAGSTMPTTESRTDSHRPPLETVTVVIPALNQEKQIAATIADIPFQELRMMGYIVEALVVDGNSRDRTREIASKLGATVVTIREDDPSAVAHSDWKAWSLTGWSSSPMIEQLHERLSRLHDWKPLPTFQSISHRKTASNSLTTASPNVLREKLCTERRPFFPSFIRSDRECSNFSNLSASSS